MARGKRQIQSRTGETGSSAAGSAANAGGMGAAASAASAGHETHPAGTPVEEASPITKLPPELIEHIASFLGNSAAAALAQTSPLFHDILNDAGNPASMANRRAAQELLLCVANGDEEVVAAILQVRPDLLTMRTLNFYDVHTDTHFVGVSAWEYALWAGDTRYMANRMLHCIPDNINGVKIKALVKQQYEQHNQRDEEGNPLGLECLAEDGTHYFQKHFDIQPLLTAYTSYIEAYTALLNGTPLPNAPDWDAIDRLWLAVGMVQRRLVMHLRQHYCDGERDFNSLNGGHDGLARSSTFFNLLTSVKEAWDSRADSRLGFDFGIYATEARHGSVGYAGGARSPTRGLRVPRELGARNSAAVAALCEVRTTWDYVALGARLASDLNPTPGSAGLR